MAQKELYDLFVKALQQIAKDIITLLPKLIIVVVVVAIAILVIRLLNMVFRKILKIVDLDGMFKRLVKTELPFSLNNLIIALIDIGVFLIALFGITNLFLEPHQIELMKGVFEYGARIISVIAVIVFTFIVFNILIERIHAATRMRGYVVFILLILITMMVIDLTALSTSTKHALEQGLSIGLGISVGIFAVWFFFHEYIDKLLSARTKE